MNRIQTDCEVLFISHDADMGKLVELILATHRDDKVTWRPGLREALTEIKQSQPDLILVDFLQRELDSFEPNSFEICQQLMAVPGLQGVPILLWHVTGPLRQVYQKAQQLGIAGCIAIPPYTTEELLMARDAAIGGKTYYPPLCTDSGKIE